MIKEKRGLSQVVATVLLILITVAAAVIIAGFIIPWIRGGLNSTECFNYKDYFTFENDYGYNCYRGYTDLDSTYLISITAKSGLNETQENVVGFGLALIKQGDSTVLTVNGGDSPATMGIFMNSDIEAGIEGDLALPKSGEVRTYYYNNSNTFESARVYPILKSGRKCEPSDTVAITECEN